MHYIQLYKSPIYVWVIGLSLFTPHTLFSSWTPMHYHPDVRMTKTRQGQSRAIIKTTPGTKRMTDSSRIETSSAQLLPYSLPLSAQHKKKVF